MANYEVKINRSSRKMDFVETVKVKDFMLGESLDRMVQPGLDTLVSYEAYALLDVHNENVENKDYQVIVIFDKDGQMYYTGSASFINKLMDILDSAAEANYTGDITIRVVKMESKKRQGKHFITCSLSK